MKDQQYNKQDTMYVDYNGEHIKLYDLCKKLDLRYGLIRNRITKYGFTIEEAINLPLNQKRKYYKK